MAVKVIRKFRLLFDVNFGTPSDGDVPTYDAGTDKLIMAAPTGGGGGPPSGAAGGVLGGTYPDPSFAVDMATQAEVDTAIAAAISGLVDTAPGTLDTLNELAAALGDDPNFATTVTSALAGKQPLDSDLTSIAALTTTAFGRSLLELANAGALAVAAGAVDSVAQTGHGLVAGDVVRLSGTNYVKAQADTEANAEVVGIVLTVPDADTFTLRSSGLATGISGDDASNPLSPDDVYYLSATVAGKLTSTEPTISKPVLVASSTTAGWFVNYRGLSAGSPLQASDISITDAANDFTATDVEGALAELQSDAEADATALSDHIADTSDAHDASAISVADSGGYYAASEVEAALQELGPRDAVVAYAELTTTVTRAGSEIAVVTAGAFTADGTSSYMVEFYAPFMANGGASVTAILKLRQNPAGANTDLGILSQITGASFQVPIHVMRKITPASGSQTFRITLDRTAGASEPSVFGGAGGAGNYMPAFIRVRRIG